MLIRNTREIWRNGSKDRAIFPLGRSCIDEGTCLCLFVCGIITSWRSGNASHPCVSPSLVSEPYSQ